MTDITNPNVLLDSYDINHYDFRTMINKKSNDNVAKFAALLMILKKEFSDLEITNNMSYSYEVAKGIPQAALSLIMSIPTFNFWLLISENLIRRLINNEAIPFKDVPHMQGVFNLSELDILEYHLMDINRYILSMSILSCNPVKLSCPIYEGKLVIPYYGININVSSEKKMVEVVINASDLNTLIIDNTNSINLSNNISSFKSGENLFIENKDISQSQSILFSKGRIILNSYDPYYKYEIIIPYVFPNNLKASSPDYKELVNWGNLIKNTQKILYKYWPEIEDVIGFYIHEIVPIKSPLTDVDISCTSSTFHGTVFCSDTEPYQMAEVLIHEFSHNLLNDVMDNYDIFDSEYSKEEEFYSPWRNDPRHLKGILHAIYVFEKVAEYYSRLLKNNIKIDIYDYRYSLIVSRLKIALTTLVDNSILTKFGQKFIDLLSDKINRHFKNKDYDYKLSKDEIDKHHNKWIIDNKNKAKPRIN